MCLQNSEMTLFFKERTELSEIEGSVRIIFFNLYEREIQKDGLFVQPDIVKLLVKVVAWGNFPAFDIRPVRIDLIPPQGDANMSHLTQSSCFVLTYQPSLL